MKTKAKAKKPGRPTKYTKALGEKICLRICDGESLRSICRDEKMPTRSTVHLWLLDETKKEFSDQYKFAVDVRTDNMFDEIEEIADDGTNDWTERELNDGYVVTVVNSEHIQRSRLRVDVRKWALSKLMPKKYGDKLDLTTDGEKLPTPLLPYEIFNNNSDEESSGAQ